MNTVAFFVVDIKFLEPLDNLAFAISYFVKSKAGKGCVDGGENPAVTIDLIASGV